MEKNHKNLEIHIAPQSLNLNIDSEHILDFKNKKPTPYSRIVNSFKEYATDDLDDMYHSEIGRVTRTPYAESLLEKKISKNYLTDSNL